MMIRAREKISWQIWRTKSGNEPDFVVYGQDTFCAIEVKNSVHIHPKMLNGLTAFRQDYPEALRETGNYQKGDERILGDGQFVDEVLKKAEEGFKEKYRLKAKGYNLEKLIKRVAEITHLTPEQITDGVRDAKRTKARSILCYWATEKLGTTQSQLAQLLNRTQTAIVYAVRRGREIVEGNSYLIE